MVAVRVSHTVSGSVAAQVMSGKVAIRSEQELNFMTVSPMTPNAPMSGAGVRSTEASAPLAGWAAAIFFVVLTELP